MALDMFINLGTKIKGETKDKVQGPKGDVDVLAWSWGMSQSGTLHTGGGGGAGKVNIQDLSFTKYIDRASAPLQQLCAKGTHIETVLLTVRKAGETQQKYIEITLAPVIVTSVSTGGSGGEDRLTENVTLNFATVKFEYFAQDAKGVVASAGTYTYDIAANAES